jgi:DNA invertase Pin-like site-specific DNA recombinase
VRQCATGKLEDLTTSLFAICGSEKRDDRPGLEACLRALREGDTLIVWKLDVSAAIWPISSPVSATWTGAA